MRKLLIMRGAPGCGKSTWIDSHRLGLHTISSDAVRLLMRAPIMDTDGSFGLDQSNGKKIWAFIHQLAEERMERGEFLVIDATHQKGQEIKKWLSLAEKYFYKMAIVDFTKLPKDVCIKQNMSRESFKQVPDLAIDRAYERFEGAPTAGFGVTTIAVDTGDGSSSREYIELCKFLYSSDIHEQYVPTQPMKSTVGPILSHTVYKKIHHIGDIQGCYNPLKKYFDGANGFKDDELYIFHGDYLDRGPDNDLVLEFMLENFERPNVIVLRGNHEAHLGPYVRGEVSRSEEFEARTRGQLDKHGFDKKLITKFMWHLQDVYWYYIDVPITGSMAVQCVHGAMPVFINANRAHEITSRQFWFGVKVYHEDTAAHFVNNELKNNPNMIQIHGHRNKENLAIDHHKSCLNLEGAVEYPGGALRIATYSVEGWQYIYVPSDNNIDNFTPYP